MGQYGGIQRPSRRDDQMPMGGFGPESLAGQEQYIPVPPGQPVGIATNGMPVPQTFGPYVGNAGGFGNKGGQARQMGYAPMRQGLGGFF